MVHLEPSRPNHHCRSAVSTSFSQVLSAAEHYIKSVLPSTRPSTCLYHHYGARGTSECAAKLDSCLGSRTLQNWASNYPRTNYLYVLRLHTLRFIGAPIASSISFDIMALAYIIHVCFINPPDAWHPINRLCFQELGKLFRLGLSTTGQIASEWWCWEIVALAASQ
jgi:hypothetical protein